MENLEEKLPFIINPNLRLNSPNFNISWHLVDFNILQTEATFPCNGRKSFFHGKRYELIVQYNEEQLDIIYSGKTDWDILKLQQWIRIVIRDAIIKRAEEVLPMRLHGNILSGLLGRDANQAKIESSLFFCKYAELFYFIMKK